MIEARTVPTGLLAAGGGGRAADAFMGVGRGTKDAGTVAREFAGLFYGMVLGEMAKTVPENSFFSGPGEGMFRSMWVKELGRALAYQKGDALSGAIVKDLARYDNTDAEPI